MHNSGDDDDEGPGAVYYWPDPTSDIAYAVEGYTVTPLLMRRPAGLSTAYRVMPGFRFRPDGSVCWAPPAGLRSSAGAWYMQTALLNVLLGCPSATRSDSVRRTPVRAVRDRYMLSHGGVTCVCGAGPDAAHLGVRAGQNVSRLCRDAYGVVELPGKSFSVDAACMANKGLEQVLPARFTVLSASTPDHAPVLAMLERAQTTPTWALSALCALDWDSHVCTLDTIRNAIASGRVACVAEEPATRHCAPRVLLATDVVVADVGTLCDFVLAFAVAAQCVRHPSIELLGLVDTPANVQLLLRALPPAVGVGRLHGQLYVFSTLLADASSAARAAVCVRVEPHVASDCEIRGFASPPPGQSTVHHCVHADDRHMHAADVLLVMTDYNSTAVRYVVAPEVAAHLAEAWDFLDQPGWCVLTA